MSFIALMLRSNGDGKPSPFQALHALSDNQNEYRCVLLSFPANQSTSFKGRAAKQTEHREAMTKQDGKRQIKLA